eukprot:4393332-Pyramimonas_sp.AAC.1
MQTTGATVTVNSVLTSNSTPYGAMKDVLSLPQRRGAITCLQEHHGGEQRIPELQHKARQFGRQGVWTAAISTGRGGTTGGCAIVAPKHIRVGLGPHLSSPTVVPGRVTVGHASWGPRGG